MTAPIYLDHNATTPQLPEVADAVREAALRYTANPESQHGPGRTARRVLEESREQIGRLLGARNEGMVADQVIFTSGGTEANNLVLLGLTRMGLPRAGSPGHLVVSAIEHPCVLETATLIEQHGWQVDRAMADTDGVVQPEEFARFLSPETRLASLMLANNETGVLQPVAAVAGLCAELGILMHTDASQAIGKIPVNFAQLNVAALCCAAHKFHGPVGIGAVILQHGVKLRPSLFGGHQQAGIRPGTESVPLAVGMRTALELWHRETLERSDRLTELRDQFESDLLAELPSALVIGSRAERLPNTSNIGFTDYDRQALLMALDQAGVACATGSACASGSSEPSPTLVAMGLEEQTISGSIRFSLGATTGRLEMAEATHRILSVCKRLRQG